jgi:hypothetical protein
MTFNPAVPLNSDSPSIFPAQNQTNMARLQTIVGADHQFNLSAAADDGYHNIIHMTQQAPSGALPATGRGYAASANGRIHQFYMDDIGRAFQITPTIPIYAAVNFNGDAGSPCPIRFSHNVSSVVRTASGFFTINFTTPLPSNNYIVQGTCMRDTSTCLMQIRSDPTYGSQVTTSFVNIRTFSLGDNSTNPLACFVLICGG